MQAAWKQTSDCSSDLVSVVGLSAGLSYAHGKGLEMTRESHNNPFALAGGGG